MTAAPGSGRTEESATTRPPAEADAPVLATRAGGLLTVTINRPRKRNALSREALAALEAAFDEAARDPDIRCAVVTAAGEASFAAGGDLKDLAEIRTDAEARAFAAEAKATLGAIRDFPVPVVAAVNGDALGGGAEVAIAADMRVFAPHARIGFIQGRLAITTAWGGASDLLRLVGPATALRLLTRCEVLDAEAARAAGLADAVAAEGEPLAEAVAAFVAPILKQPRQVLEGFKALAGADRTAGRARLDEIETAVFAATWVHDDHWAAVDALTRKPATGTVAAAPSDGEERR